MRTATIPSVLPTPRWPRVRLRPHSANRDALGPGPTDREGGTDQNSISFPPRQQSLLMGQLWGCPPRGLGTSGTFSHRLSMCYALSLPRQLEPQKHRAKGHAAPGLLEFPAMMACLPAVTFSIGLRSRTVAPSPHHRVHTLAFPLVVLCCA